MGGGLIESIRYTSPRIKEVITNNDKNVKKIDDDLKLKPKGKIQVRAIIKLEQL